MAMDVAADMTPVILRPDQAALKQAIYNEWNSGHNVVAGILATGGGKSIITTDIILDGHRDGLTEVVMAHRNELVGQMSLHVARRGIPHRIIGSSKTVSGIIQEHRAEFGRSFVNPDAKCSVGSVQTIVSRLDQLKQWGAQVDRFTGDEGHHFLRENMWGKAARLFTNARGLLVTACPQRADGAGLGSHADGIVDAMVVGPPMRELINLFALSDYEIFIPQTEKDARCVEALAHRQRCSHRIPEVDQRQKSDMLRNRRRDSERYCRSVQCGWHRCSVGQRENR